MAAWAGASAATLALGFGLAGLGLVVAVLVRAGHAPTHLQLSVWWLIGRELLVQALAPHLLLTLVLWALLAGRLPAERSWRGLVPGVLLACVLTFPLAVARFTMWRPRDASDVAGTCALMTLATMTALLLPRLVLHPLAPGALARRRSAA